MLIIPAFIGWLIHLPLYLPVQKSVFRKTAHNDHYDSVMAAILLFTYPLYLLLISFIAFYITKSSLSFLFLLLLPFTAWCYVQLKPQLDKQLKSFVDLLLKHFSYPGIYLFDFCMSLYRLCLNILTDHRFTTCYDQFWSLLPSFAFHKPIRSLRKNLF